MKMKLWNDKTLNEVEMDIRVYDTGRTKGYYIHGRKSSWGTRKLIFKGKQPGSWYTSSSNGVRTYYTEAEVIDTTPPSYARTDALIKWLTQ